MIDETDHKHPGTILTPSIVKAGSVPLSMIQEVVLMAVLFCSHVVKAEW